MKINENGAGDSAKISRVTTSSPRRTQDTENSSKVTDGGEAASVKLSGISQQVRAEAASAPVDTQKVKEITEAIKKGEFKINPEVIADALIKFSDAGNAPAAA